MATPSFARCKGCRKPKSEVGTLSWTGLCAVCSIERLESNVNQMHRRSGPNFDKWRRNMAAAVGGVLLDDAVNSRHSPE